MEAWARSAARRLRGPIEVLDALRDAPPPPRCDVRRQGRLESELSGWLAVARARAPMRVTVVIPDDTRPLCPSLLVPPVLGCIAEAAQRRQERVRAHVLVATGLHRPPKDGFLNQLKRAVEAFRADTRVEVGWSWHDARETQRAGFPLNPRVLARDDHGGTDAVITVGLVEPHQYAGFSGGSKALSVGCGSTSTIAALHSLRLLREPGTTIGQLRGNPFRDALDAVAATHAAPCFGVSLVPDPSGRGFAGVFAGPGPQMYHEAVALAQRLLLVGVGRAYDFAVVRAPDPKAGSFYQASRALTYLALHPQPCVREGGTLVLDAPCHEGFGLGDGERAFREALSKGRARLLAELHGAQDAPQEPGGGAQRAYVLAKVLERFRCVLVGAPPLPEAQSLGLQQSSALEDIHLEGAGLLVDDPFVRMPFLGTEVQSVERLPLASPDRALGGAASPPA
jgi:nickel-dependent lactate racemase